MSIRIEVIADSADQAIVELETLLANTRVASQNQQAAGVTSTPEEQKALLNPEPEEKPKKKPARKAPAKKKAEEKPADDFIEEEMVAPVEEQDDRPFEVVQADGTPFSKYKLQSGAMKKLTELVEKAKTEDELNALNSNNIACVQRFDAGGQDEFHSLIDDAYNRVTAEEDGSEDGDEVTPYTKEEVKAVVADFLAQHADGLQVAQTLAKKYGATKFSELKEEHYADFIADLDAHASGAKAA